MKQFFGAFFGAIVGVVVANVIVTILSFAFLVWVFSKVAETFKKEKITTSVSQYVPDNGILRIRIDERFTILESRGGTATMLSMALSRMTALTSYSVFNRIEKAAWDSRIKGCLIEVINPGEITLSQMHEMREALKKFKENGKFLYGYTLFVEPYYLYLLSVCDTVVLHRDGFAVWNGLASMVFYYKRLFDKIGVTFKDYRGPNNVYKSFAEPFTEDSMSQYLRVQLMDVLNDRWEIMASRIGEKVRKSVEELNNMANMLSIKTPQDALQNGLVDILGDDNTITEIIEKRAGDFEFVDIVKYHPEENSSGSEMETSGEVAIVYASGDIYTANEKNKEGINSTYYAKLLEEIAEDEDIKAVVLRVVSPGGSALASEIIATEIEKVKEKKPVVVSMGSVAGSGGYYISCVASKIVATPFTITGSIGVLGVMLNASSLFRDKLGIIPQVVETHKYGDLLSVMRPLDPEEENFLQANLDSVYYQFVRRVASGRNMSAEMVDEYGRGRIWSGIKGKKLGLVDTIGTLLDAIRMAASLAGLSTYEVVEYPRPRWWEELGIDVDIEVAKVISGDMLVEAFNRADNLIKSIVRGGTLQYRMPLVIYDGAQGISSLWTAELTALTREK